MTRATRRTTIYDIAVAAGCVSNDCQSCSQRFLAEVSNKAARLPVAFWRAPRSLATPSISRRGDCGLSRSGLAGMIMPHYRNRFFAGLAEAFEGGARARGLCPIVVSTHRHPGNELKAVETLLAQQVEFLLIAGVRDPDPLNDLCRAAGVRCVNIDLPGPRAPSVVSDNRGGARQLTEVVLRKGINRRADATDLFFFGGDFDDDATRNRVAGFKDALIAHGIVPAPHMFDCCGYPRPMLPLSLAAKHAQLGRLPSQLFVNGVTALEGALRFTSTLPRHRALRHRRRMLRLGSVRGASPVRRHHGASER